jgi:hypothetical protein
VDPTRGFFKFYTPLIPMSNKYIDYREMLDKEKGIDALTISTPDHNHAKIAYDCMNSGIHVYVQKPLTHTIAEARLLKHKLLKKIKLLPKWVIREGPVLEFPKFNSGSTKTKLEKYTPYMLGQIGLFGHKE